MLARFSKYDFWIPGKILDLYRKKSTKNKMFRDQLFLSKKSKKYFPRPKIFEEKIIWKINEKWKFQNFDFYLEKNKILKFSLFIDFFIGIFFENFLVSKNIFSTFSTNCFDLENFIFLWNFFYINPKFSQESKNHT